MYNKSYKSPAKCWVIFYFVFMAISTLFANNPVLAEDADCRGDNVPPTLSCPDNVIGSVICGEKCTSVTFGTPQIWDNCDVAPKAYIEYDRRYCFPIGTTNVRVWGIDKSGNMSTCSFKVTISLRTDYVDSYPPGYYCPKDIFKEVAATEKCAKVDFEDITPKDDCDLNPVVTSSAKSNDCFPIGTTVVTRTAKDKSGHSTTCTFNIIVFVKPKSIAQTDNSSTNSLTKHSSTPDFKVFPNPVTNQLNVELQRFQGKSVTVQLFNTLGQQVYTAKLPEVMDNLHTVDAQNLARGSYIIRVSAEGEEAITKRMIKN